MVITIIAMAVIKEDINFKDLIVIIYNYFSTIIINNTIRVIG